MKYVLLLLAMCVASASMATSVAFKPLEEMLREADHVLIARITRVDMVDGKRRPVTDRRARTGPGLDNEIRLHLKLEEPMFARSDAPPATMTVPLWRAWHYELGSMQDQLTGSSGIFLLKSDFEPVYPADFQRGLHERPEIERLLLTLR